MQERYKPQWAEIKESYERTIELVEAHRQQQAAQKRPADDAIHEEHDRGHAIAAQRGHYLGEFERALWLAKEEYALLLRKFEALTEPKGKGHRRPAEPSRADRINALTDLLLRLAQDDKAKAKARQRTGGSPPSLHIMDLRILMPGENSIAAALGRKQPASILNAFSERDCGLE